LILPDAFRIDLFFPFGTFSSLLRSSTTVTFFALILWFVAFFLAFWEATTQSELGLKVCFLPQVVLRPNNLDSALAVEL